MGGTDEALACLHCRETTVATRKVSYCPYCGTQRRETLPLAEGSRRRVKPSVASDNPEHVVCPRCKSVSETAWNYCFSCGSRFLKAEGQPQGLVTFGRAQCLGDTRGEERSPSETELHFTPYAVLMGEEGSWPIARMSDVRSVELLGEQQAKSKWAATFFLGVWGLAAKGSAQFTYLTIHLSSGDDVYLVLRKWTHMDVRASLAPMLKAANVPFEDNLESALPATPQPGVLDEPGSFSRRVPLLRRSIGKSRTVTSARGKTEEDTSIATPPLCPRGRTRAPLKGRLVVGMRRTSAAQERSSCGPQNVETSNLSVALPGCRQRFCSSIPRRYTRLAYPARISESACTWAFSHGIGYPVSRRRGGAESTSRGQVRGQTHAIGYHPIYTWKPWRPPRPRPITDWGSWLDSGKDPAAILSKVPDAVDELVSLVRRVAPRDLPPSPMWPVVGACCMAKATCSMESLMAILRARRYLDGWLLARSLYETVITFAWIAIDPDEHIKRLVRDSWGELLRADKSVRSFADFSILPDEVELLFMDVRNYDLGDPPSVFDMTRQCDERWHMPTLDLDDPRLGLESCEPVTLEHLMRVGALSSSFRGLYDLLYRTGSAAGHGDLWMMLERFSQHRKGGWTIHFEEGSSSLHPLRQPAMPFLVAPALYAEAMRLSSHFLGWPDEEECSAADVRYGTRVGYFEEDEHPT